MGQALGDADEKVAVERPEQVPVTGKGSVWSRRSHFGCRIHSRVSNGRMQGEDCGKMSGLASSSRGRRKSTGQRAMWREPEVGLQLSDGGGGCTAGE